jgi:hypothetical protein
MAYQRGRELLLREFSRADGVFGESGKQAGPLLEDGVTHMMAGGHTSSCVTCHNTPWRDLGAGVTIAKNSGRGRDTPHLFGAGLLETLGIQGRRDLTARVDRNRDGWISKQEAEGERAWLVPAREGHGVSRKRVDLGRYDDVDGDGRPDLDPVLAVWYVDAQGRRISWARTLEDSGVAGYRIEYQVFGFGHHPRQTEHGPPVASTLRAFTATAFDLHSGMQAHDPTILEDPDGDGVSGTSLSGAPQFLSAASRDRGRVRDSTGVSLDDPDRDGVVEEVSQGDLDLAEHFLLNHPRPAERHRGPRAVLGRRLFDRIGCARCHVPDWEIRAAADGGPGDRRFFDLATDLDDAGRLRGRVVSVERGSGVLVRGLYSDLRSHDLGEGFREVQFDGSVITRHRTTPLWGVGSTAPYGHDGASLDLDAVILRHGGEAADSSEAYRDLSELERESVLRFLRGLVLYSTEELPCDVDGDGEVAANFLVAGQDTGRERLNPEWLFQVPGRIEGPTTGPDGSRVVSQALTNLGEAYGFDLEYLRDSDGDGFPDRRDVRPHDPGLPRAPGYRGE